MHAHAHMHDLVVHGLVVHAHISGPCRSAGLRDRAGRASPQRATGLMGAGAGASREGATVPRPHSAGASDPASLFYGRGIFSQFFSMHVYKRNIFHKEVYFQIFFPISSRRVFVFLFKPHTTTNP
jgi:hypothetical protein